MLEGQIEEPSLQRFHQPVCACRDGIFCQRQSLGIGSKRLGIIAIEIPRQLIEEYKEGEGPAGRDGQVIEIAPSGLAGGIGEALSQ